MIYQAFHAIQQELSTYLGNGAMIKEGNVAEMLAGNNQPDDNPDLIMSLINIEENRVSRDPLNYVRQGKEISIKNPAVHLNITLLFTSIKDGAAYGTGLQNIQRVIEFFQGKSVFDHANTQNMDVGIEKLILEMLSLNLEQLHQLWSMLGGKYHPSVAYRMRMITIDTDVVNQSVRRTEEININSNFIDK